MLVHQSLSISVTNQKALTIQTWRKIHSISQAWIFAMHLCILTKNNNYNLVDPKGQMRKQRDQQKLTILSYTIPETISHFISQLYYFTAYCCDTFLQNYIKHCRNTTNLEQVNHTKCEGWTDKLHSYTLLWLHSRQLWKTS